MAQQYQPLDLTTLQEVERLLTSTDFATADDLRGRGIASSTAPRRDVLVSSEGHAPLPKRG